MTILSVWSPLADSVELEIKNRRVAMERRNTGWWRVAESSVKHGVDYAFRVDGEGPFPDPRSPWQPQGVHGPSRHLDHAQFEWTDIGWQQPPLGAAIIYELHVGTLTHQGTFQAAIERLDHLVDLGVTHIELMPVAGFSGHRGWGYDGVNLFAPHQPYGGPVGLKQLVDACHNRGLAVLLDVVYNHLGPDGNYLGRFGPYFTSRYTTPWGEAVNLDGPNSDQVRRFFIDNALMWLRDYHLDGLRIDAVHAIVDTSAYHFLEQLADEVKILEAKLGRQLVLIAESDLNDPRLIRSSEAGGYGLDAQWSDDVHHALHAVLTGERDGYYRDFGLLESLAKALRRGVVYDGCYSIYRQRRHGRPYPKLSGHRFICCLQNHDQVGNRALGERTAKLLTSAQLKLGAALLLTAPFVPLLFQGEEWGATTPFLFFTDYRDPELGEKVSQGRRDEFSSFDWIPEEIPDPQAEATFLRSRLNWDEVSSKPHAELLAWHRALIQLRRQHPALRDGLLERVGVEFDATDRWLIMRRGSISVVCNFADTPRSFPSANLAAKRILLASTREVSMSGRGLELPAYGVVILGG